MLVGEDDQRLAAVLRQGLKEQGYGVDLAPGADQGFAMAMDSDYDVGSNLVEVYVNYLRRKTEQNDAPRLIQTVRGAGYVLKEAD